MRQRKPSTWSGKPRTQSNDEIVRAVIQRNGCFQIDHRKMGYWDKHAFKMLKAGKLVVKHHHGHIQAVCTPP